MSGKAVPRYQQIKDYLLAEIQAGKWREGEAIPPEMGLAQQFGVSRMTVNRAVRELTDEKFLKRIQGSGTYVAHRKYQATLVAIKNIADEVRGRGHEHSSRLLLLDSAPATESQAVDFEVEPGHLLFHSVIVHFDNHIPIQYEDRWVNSSVAPDYLKLDFSISTPNEHLMKVAPLQGVNYCIEAVDAPAEIARHLDVPEGEACLVLYRTTLALGQVASVATMWYPGSRYQFAGGL
jgi:GntR family histidine utilization transcriptional repressor